MSQGQFEIDSKAFVTGEGLAKVKAVTDSGVSVWLIRAARIVEVERMRVRPLLSRSEAQALLRELQKPLPEAGTGPGISDAARLVTSSNDAFALVSALRGLYARATPGAGGIEAIAALESLLCAELSLVLGLPVAQLNFTQTRPSRRPVRTGDDRWLQQLRGAGIETADTPLEHEVRCIRIPSGIPPFELWRRAWDALDSVDMYPVIVAADLEGLDGPDTDLGGIARERRSQQNPSPPSWSEVELVGECVLAVMPFRSPWLVAPYLRFGGWNDCPRPEVHARMHLAWHDDFGAFPVCIERSSLDMVVQRPPSGATASRILEQHLDYCDDLEQFGRAKLREMVTGPLWSFWWD